MNKILKPTLILGFVAVVLLGCKKEYDMPPVQTLATGDVKTIADIRAMYQGQTVRFEDDYSVYAVVTADEKSGNLYKQVYVEDVTGAIQLRLLNSGGLYEGDSIRIAMKGIVLSSYNDMLQLDSVDVDKNVIKQAVDMDRNPKVMTLDQLSASYQGQLIKLVDVQFQAQEIGGTYADGVNQTSQNRMLEDCSGNALLVRTSGYANFANEIIPGGKGSIVGVLSQFGSTLQFTIRRTNEIIMNDKRCTIKNFEDGDLFSGGWTTQLVSGPASCEWAVYSSSNSLAKVSNYSGVNAACESWLISPKLDLSAAATPTLSFDNLFRYTGAPLEVYVSTDYDGVSTPSSATWTLLNPVLDTVDDGWSPLTHSGPVDLSAYKTSGTYIGFKYTGSATDGSTWEVDNIVVTQ